jgi:DNA-binding NtrC family response regulator
MDSRLSTSLTSLPSGREVLVVEDELRIRNMLSQAMKQMGYNATLVSTAEAARRAMDQRALDHGAFDILILDLNLPGMGGLEFLESLRGKQCDLQVIILTGFGDLDAARKAIHFDVVEFLTKPCTLGSLEIALERARRRRRGQIVGQPGAMPEVALQFDSPEPEPSVPPESAGTADGSALSMEELEQRHILGVLRKHNGNRAATAAELGISLRKMYYRLSEYQRKGLL